MRSHQGSAFSGVMFITGTTIGAGMLGIPFMTSLCGFLPGLAATFLSWIFMWLTGLVFFEAILWMPDGANILSTSQRFLGRWGKAFAGVVFLFLSYGMLIAYFDGAAPLITTALNTLFSTHWPVIVGFVFLTVVFGGVVLIGTWVADRLNTLLVAGMLIAYLGMMGLGAFEVEASRLEHQDWPFFLFAAPVLFSAFGYHSIIPSMTAYLQRNARAMRWSLFLGTFIPFVVYSLWQWLVLGSIPPEDLKASWENSEPIASIMLTGPASLWFARCIQFFSFFAIVTSLMGVSISTIDFFADGLKVARTGSWRLVLTLLTLVPPAYIAQSNPGIFLHALGVAGGFGEAAFDALLPLAIVWVGRYHYKLPGAHQLGGGKLTLVALALFTLLIVATEVLALVGPH